MRKYILLAVCAVALTFTSCSNSEEIDIKYQVNVTVDPSTVTGAFHGYLNGGETYGLNMDENSKLLITSLIYDSSDNLVEKKTVFVDDYNNSTKYSLSMKEGEEYTVVAITYSVDMVEEFASYSLLNEDRLDKLSITSQVKNGDSFYSNWSMLGVAVETISSVETENIIYVKPASAIVVLVFNNIHAFDAAGVDTHWIAYKNNDMAQIENGMVEFGATSATNSGYLYNLDVTENPNSKNIFIMLNLLPTPNMAAWAGCSIGENDVRYSDFLENSGADPSLGTGVIDIEAGKEYRFDVYCGECKIALTGMSRSAVGSQSNVEKVGVENKANINHVITPRQTANVMELLDALK